MAEYIERESTLHHMKVDIRPPFAVVADMPAANVAPVVYANWKYHHKKNIAVCTNCSFERDLDANFGQAISCPNCGSRMDKEADCE